MSIPLHHDDWTGGTEAIVFETCDACRKRWYFTRSRCPTCGGSVTRSPSRGEGTLCAVTTVSRPPAPELRAYAPYRIALVEIDEGFRMMGHADDGLAVGDRVRSGYRRLGSVLVPFFSAMKAPLTGAPLRRESLT